MFCLLVVLSTTTTVLNHYKLLETFFWLVEEIKLLRCMLCTNLLSNLSPKTNAGLCPLSAHGIICIHAVGSIRNFVKGILLLLPASSLL
uniref:Secreted protein n=1 Tax=Pyxicephalus adspersus TaxID=30357 RepID=A0AAV3A463_PYXAD|nr:TPA: hypothetical protein GDO54_017891 [Pyxicephalus adspersus]